nr:FUSC family protein [Streptomyces sp. HNM0575]
MSSGSRGRLSEFWDRVVASDPGLNRLRMAVSAAVAMSSTLALEYVFGQVAGAGRQGTTIGMLLGAIVAMMGSMALTGTGVRTKAVTAVFFPVAMGAGMLAGVVVAGHTDVMLCVFVGVMFVAVFVRRFGMRFFFYGFMLWMGYFFAAFLNAELTMLPGLLTAIAVASAWVLLLSVTVLRTNARRTLRRVRSAFGARARAVARACADLLEADEQDAAQQGRLHRRLHARQLRLAEAALMIEGWSAERGALPEGWSGPALRRRLLDAQLAIDALANAADALAGTGPRFARDGARIAAHLARWDYRAAEQAARPFLDPPSSRTDGGPHDNADRDRDRDRDRDKDKDGEGDGQWPLHQLASAAAEFVSVVATSDVPSLTGTGQSEDFEPVVALALGNLPGSASVAGDVAARGSWNPLSRMKLTTRQSVQVAFAGALAIVLGRQISEDRYYWAVIAAFIAFTGTGTRSETFIKATNRVVGTVAGLGAGIGLAHLTVGHTAWVLIVIVVSMSCGFYLVRVSYAFMIFFVTIMVSQLYGVLHELSAGLLVLRLEETAAGAVAGIVVSLVVIPTSTRDTAGSAQRTFFIALADLLRATAARLGEGGTDEAPAGAAAGIDTGSGTAGTDEEHADLDTLVRALDHRMSQLALVSRPLTRTLVWGNDPGLVRHRLTLCTAAARQGRALALSTARLPAPVPPNGLGPICHTLAEAVTALAGSPPRRSAAVAEAERRLQDVEAELLAQHPPCAGPSLPPVTRPLTHLRRLVHELACTPPVAPARGRHAGGSGSGPEDRQPQAAEVIVADSPARATPVLDARAELTGR